ncbi:hypothetical protein KAH27_06775, partial [bacterium]|nr:hypothetical protein [bacterium]
WGKTKMSKSLGNIIYINGLVEKGYSAVAIRYTLLTTHYRQKLNFSLEMLDSSESALKRIDNFMEDIIHWFPGKLSEEIQNIVDTMLKGFEKSMDDDLNISPAMAAVYTAIKEINKVKDIRTLTEGDHDYIVKNINRIDSVLGVFPNSKRTGSIETHALELFEERRNARANKNWTESDRLRDALDALGYIVIDRKDGSELKVKKN